MGGTLRNRAWGGILRNRDWAVLYETGLGAVLYQTGLWAVLYQTGLGAVLYQTGLGAVLYQAGLRAVLYQAGLGAVLYQTGLGAVLYKTGLGAVPYQTGLGTVLYQTGFGAVTEKFSVYLYYGPPFEVFTDNDPLTYVMTSAKWNACGLRQVAQLANYKFVLKFRSGKSNIDVDFLSRMPKKGDVYEAMTNSDVTSTTDDINLGLSGVKMGCEVSAGVDILTLTETKDSSGGNPIKISNEKLGETQKEDNTIAPVYKMLRSGGKK